MLTGLAAAGYWTTMETRCLVLVTYKVEANRKWTETGLAPSPFGGCFAIIEEIVTHDRSKGVAGCVEPPIVCAKLVMAPLLERGFPRPALPIGTPPPNAHVVPLLPKTPQFS